MCSSPKSSSARRRHAKKKALTTHEYEEYSAMLKRSFAAYEQVQLQKAARTEQVSANAATVNVETTQVLVLKPTLDFDKGFWNRLRAVFLIN